MKGKKRPKQKSPIKKPKQMPDIIPGEREEILHTEEKKPTTKKKTLKDNQKPKK